MCCSLSFEHRNLTTLAQQWCEFEEGMFLGQENQLKNFSQPKDKNSPFCKKKVSVFRCFIFLWIGVFTYGIDLFGECTITWTSLSTVVIKSELEFAVEVKLHKTNPRRQPPHIHNQWLTYIFPQLAISYNYSALGMMRALQSSSPKQSSLSFGSL